MRYKTSTIKPNGAREVARRKRQIDAGQLQYAWRNFLCRQSVKGTFTIDALLPTYPKRSA